MVKTPTVYELLLTSYQKSLLRKIDSIATRSELIARFYLEIEYQKKGLTYIHKVSGADITIKTGRRSISFEVKGTRDEDIALNKLKVSSNNSYKLLKSGVTVIRVMKAHTTKPLIAEMICGKHFNLKREPRWRATK